MNNFSLLPYITGSGAPFTLEFSHEPGDINAGNPPRFPFEIIADTGALTRIIHARVASDAGSTVNPVFLMLSRDEYPLLENANDRITNADIEIIWQRAYQDLKDNSSLVALKTHDLSQTFTAFHPLFYCSKTRQFFHPPCPKCGHPLGLCRDDALLKASGLKPYSASLARYLSCPSCANPGESLVFYSRMPEGSDPSCVQGLSDLVRGFAQLDAGGLPCIGCPERTQCFKTGAAHSLIAPIAFYPFYLLMFKAPSLNAEDYLSLVSGARPAKLEGQLLAARQFARSRFVGLLKGREEGQTLFAGDEREFLEILFLKLSLLGEIAQHALSNEAMNTEFRFGPSLQRMWVKIPEQSSLLPAFWSFRLAMMDMDLEIPRMLPLQGPDYALRVLGVLWFQALLKNRVQDIGTINDRIGSILHGKGIDMDDAVFNACNIFWEPTPVPGRWLHFWGKVLDLGRGLLVGSSPADGFWKSFHEIRDGIRQELFSVAPGAIPLQETEKLHESGDGQIGRILRRISSRMGQATEDAEPALSAMPEVNQVRETHAEARETGAVFHTDDAEKTVILTSAHGGISIPDAEAAGVTSSPKREKPRDALGEEEKTVIPNGRNEGEKIPDAFEEDFKTETIVMQQGQVLQAPVAPTDFEATMVVSSGSPHEIDLDQTAVMSSGPKHGVDLDQTAVMGGSPAGEKAEKKIHGIESTQDDFEETVIMGAAPRKEPDLPQVKPAPDNASLDQTAIIGSETAHEKAEADDLTETVILKPKKS